MSRRFYQGAFVFLSINIIVQILFTASFTFPGVFNLDFAEFVFSLAAVGVFFIIQKIYFLIYLKYHKLTYPFVFSLALGIIYIVILCGFFLVIIKIIDRSNYNLMYYTQQLTNIFFGLSILVNKTKKTKWLTIGSYSTIIFSITFIFFAVFSEFFKGEIVFIIVTFLSLTTPFFYLKNYSFELNMTMEDNHEILDID